MKTLTLCADDFAQTPAISDTILELAGAGRLSATSVLTRSPHWREGAAALKRQGADIDVGLHFNLTHDFGGGARPLAHWLWRSQLRRLSPDRLYDIMIRQLDAFADEMGRLPDFIDGHQHVHAFPVVRNVLTEVIRQRWRVREEPYVRAPDRLRSAGDAPLKAMVLRFACRDFAWHLEGCGIDYPRWFGGFYSLDPAVDYGAWMRAWLRSYADNSLMMCHPGPAPDASAAAQDDPIAAVRGVEAAYLRSPAFAADLQAQGFQLGRFARG
jgi:predicted glycoside hydrolase/deacetylase ChbG (UPF0249 family)